MYFPQTRLTENSEIKEEIPHDIRCEKIEYFSPGNLYADDHFPF